VPACRASAGRGLETGFTEATRGDPDGRSPSGSDPRWASLTYAIPGDWAKTQIPQAVGLICNAAFLLDEKGFPKLIPAHKRLHCAESAEQVLYFAILVDLLSGAQYRR
jgi:hypothetical protein